VEAFHEVCYRIEVKEELMHAINMFLDDVSILGVCPLKGPAP
jgi:hypothetical protein